MRKIPHPLERKILQPLTHSEHEVMLSFQSIIEEWLDGSDASPHVQLNEWLDNLQEIYEKAERVDELENNLYHIDSLIDDAENSLSEIRGYTNV